MIEVEYVKGQCGFPPTFIVKGLTDEAGHRNYYDGFINCISDVEDLIAKLQSAVDTAKEDATVKTK